MLDHSGQCVKNSVVIHWRNRPYARPRTKTLGSELDVNVVEVIDEIIRYGEVWVSKGVKDPQPTS